MNTVMTSTCIRWDSLSKDYAVTIAGEYVGSRKRHDDAEDLKRTEQAKLDRQLARMTAVKI